MSETDGGAKKDEQAKKEEHITVPAKGTLNRMRENYVSCLLKFVSKPRLDELSLRSSGLSQAFF